MAADMTLNGVPNDLFQNFDPIALIIFIPVSFTNDRQHFSFIDLDPYPSQIMDMLVYPGLRRIGFIAHPIFRIFLGFMFGAAAMVYSAVLQVHNKI